MATICTQTVLQLAYKPTYVIYVKYELKRPESKY